MSYKWKLAQYLEVRWWKNYQKKLGKEYLGNKKDYWQKILAAADISAPVNKDVLDVGCGPSGIYTVMDGNRVQAVDPLLDQYESAIDFFTQNNYPEVHFFAQPFEDFDVVQTYDHVYCLNAINHFRDIEVSVQKLYACLRPGGTLLVGIDGHRHGFLKKIFQTIHMDLLHPVQMSLADYEALFSKRGFTTQKTVQYTTGNIFNYYLLKLTKE